MDNSALHTANQEFICSPNHQDQTSTQTRDKIYCGIGKCRPSCFQRLKHPLLFLFIYCLLGIIQGAYFTYFVGILSTLEKRFAFDSKITGIILIADNLSPLFFGICVGYYGNQNHRPRLIVFGMFLTTLSCLIGTLPYFIFGPGLHLLTKTDLPVSNQRNELCNMTSTDSCNYEFMSSTNPVIIILFIANFFNGAGSLFFFTVGPTYLDDSVNKKDSVIYFSVTIALRVFGPSLGYMISSFCLQFYEDPFYDPGFTNKDPRWIGAWWIGFLILGGLIIISSFPLIFFPENLNKNASLRKKEKTPVKKWKDLTASLKRIFSNPILMCHTLSLVFQINGVYGYLVFLPRYMENHFRQTASSASFYSGSTSMVAMIIGILFGGAIIRKLKPRPQCLLGYMVFVQIFTFMGLFASLFMSCPTLKLTGTSLGNGRNLDLSNHCNSACGCSKELFQPVCGPDGKTTYFSPCYAGCASIQTGNHTNQIEFFNCSCVHDVSDIFISSEVKNGYCPLDCNMFIPFIIILSISKMLDSTTRVGDVLVTLRSVNPNDKSLALGATEIIVSLLATIPFPIIYGSIVDNACIVWEESCGKEGNCWLYDNNKFRLNLHITSIVFMVLAAVLEGVVWFLGHRLKNFYNDEKENLYELEDENLADVS